MAAHRYWRFYASAVYNPAAAPTISGLELRDSPAGANLASTGNGAPSPNGNTEVGDQYGWAFDESVETVVHIAYNVPASVGWDFGAGNEKDITTAVIVTGNNSSQDPTVGRIESSDDGTTWALAIPYTYAGAGPVYTRIELARPESGNVDVSLPALTISDSFGGGYVATDLPSLTISAFGAGNGVVTLPALTADSAGRTNTNDNALAVTLPALTFSGYAGSNSKLTLPALSLSTTGTFTGWGTAELELPALIVDAVGTTTATGTAELTLPALDFIGYSGAVCSVTLGGLTVAATGTTGGIASAELTLPLFELTATATAQTYGSVDITLPALQMAPTGRAWLTLPGLTLTAIGSAVITATYEAYAVNLKHTPRGNEQPIDETTRYTNFPFTHVVRYLNSYYGANSTGLYLLEGTTDATIPIPWAVKTAMTDFKSPTKKTVASAYFAGRFGLASTVSLHAGEDTPNTYSFRTPRDRLAQNHRQVFGKGVKERYYAIGASGTDTVELDAIELDVVNTTRRI